MGLTPIAGKFLFALQITQASVGGRVVDKDSGEPLAGAVVLLTELDRSTLTDAQGRYQLFSVPSGPQHISVQLIGYHGRTLHALVPREGRIEINIGLAAQPISLRSVVVRPPIALRGAERMESPATADRTITSAAISNHPLLAEPDALLALGGGVVVTKPEAPAGVHIRGGSSDQIAYLLDGIPVLSPYHTAGVFSSWNPDAIASLQIHAAAPPPSLPDAISGVIAAATRAPGLRARAQGSLSTTQARATVDGPIAGAGAGYLVSLRGGFPSILAPSNEPSYLRGETRDGLAKLLVPAFSGTLGLLAYGSENEIDAASTRNAAPLTPRNAFNWQSLSVGADWTRSIGASSALSLRAWRAGSEAGAQWSGDELHSSTEDVGAVLLIERRGPATNGPGAAAAPSMSGGLRVNRTHTEYGSGVTTLSADVSVAALFAQYQRSAGPLALDAGGAVTAAEGALHFSPRVQLIWAAAPQVNLLASYARLQQYAQSMRNPESIVSTIFPADLYLSAGGEPGGVPIARSDQAVLAADYRPGAGIRLHLQSYLRGLHGLALVAPRTGGPYADSGFVNGSGRARGIAVDASMTGTAYGLLASYGWQRVRYRYGDTSFTPDHGAAHTIEAGVIAFPSVTTSVRMGLTGALGRRTTRLLEEIEWESCNLLDQGCDFSGTPRHDAGALGGTRLPRYLRVDLGARKHWHFDVGGRTASAALHGTVSNVFGQRNLLGYSPGAAGTGLLGVGMLPRSLLLLGLDWRF